MVFMPYMRRFVNIVFRPFIGKTIMTECVCELSRSAGSSWQIPLPVSLPSVCKNPTRGWIPPANTPMMRTMMPLCGRAGFAREARHSASEMQTGQWCPPEKLSLPPEIVFHRTTRHSPAAQIQEKCSQYSDLVARRCATAPTWP
jgi:hypothetical protein